MPQIQQVIGALAEDPREDMRELLGDWASKPVPDTDRLVDWLEGYGLPPGVHAVPYIQILDGLVGIEKKLKNEFVVRVAAFLKTEPDRIRPGDRPDEVLFNLLRLCAGLGRGDLLEAPLRAMLLRERLSGKFDGMDLRFALRDALINNQNGPSLFEVWQKMFRGEPAFLLGDSRDGMEGVARMPRDLKRPAQPDLEALGWALARFAQYLESTEEREDVFNRQLDKLTTRWGSRLWDEFPRLADKYGWPVWAADIVLDVEADDPPQKTPTSGPYVLAIAELRQLMNQPSATPEDRERYRDASLEITRECAKLVGSSLRDVYAEENFVLTQMETSFILRKENCVAEAIERARCGYMIARGTIPDRLRSN
jgi:hypothetical protein